METLESIEAGSDALMKRASDSGKKTIKKKIDDLGGGLAEVGCRDINYRHYCLLNFSVYLLYLQYTSN